MQRRHTLHAQMPTVDFVVCPETYRRPVVNVSTYRRWTVDICAYRRGFKPTVPTVDPEAPEASVGMSLVPDDAGACHGSKS